MSDIFKFPKGYNVVVLRRDDVIKCIEDNITDKDVMLEVIKQCESDVAKFIEEQRWTGVPFLGNIRIPPNKARIMSDEVQGILEDAKESLDKEKYAVFKKELYLDIAKDTKKNRYEKYELSKLITKNNNTYKHIARSKGITYAKALFYTLIGLEIVSSNGEES